jgi:hypothetical protein
VAEEGRLYAHPDSPARPLGEALAWLWRLGPALDEPDRAAVGFGDEKEAGALARLVANGRLAGAVVFAGTAGPRREEIPERRCLSGIADFGGRSRVEGDFVVFEAGHEAARSSLGVHAVRATRTLVVGAEAESWGMLSRFWMLRAVADFLIESLERPLVLLPSVGCLRLDDVPGTAQHQLEGRAKSDRKARRRIARTVHSLRRAEARLVVAVATQALAQGQPVPLDVVWPESIRALARGVGLGVLEPACHGTLHLERTAYHEGRIDPREFASLGAEEAGQRLDAATAWLREKVGEPTSFIAPAWGYSPGTLAAATERRLPTWRAPAAGPLIQGFSVFETLRGGLAGLHGLDYEPLAALARVGLPPTVVFHGGLLDLRLQTLRPPRDLFSLARLAIRRDLVRIARVKGVRWIGVRDLVARLRAHDMIEARGETFHVPPDAEATLLHPGGRRSPLSATALR